MGKITADKQNKKEFCDNLKGYRSLYPNSTNISEYHTKLSEMLDNACTFECFYVKNRLPFCAILNWIKDIEDHLKKTNKIEIGQNVADQLSGQTTSAANKMMPTGHKETSEGKEVKEQALKPKFANSSRVPDILSNDTAINSEIATIKASVEKTKSESVKPSENEIQKKGDNTRDYKPIPPASEEKKENSIDPGTNVENVKLVKNPATYKPQTVSVKNLADSAPDSNVANEGKAQQYGKEQGDVKTTTISENTQDDPDEDMESNRADMDGTDIDKIVHTHDSFLEETFV